MFDKTVGLSYEIQSAKSNVLSFQKIKVNRFNPWLVIYIRPLFRFPILSNLIHFSFPYRHNILCFHNFPTKTIKYLQKSVRFGLMTKNLFWLISFGFVFLLYLPISQPFGQDLRDSYYLFLFFLYHVVIIIYRG